MNITKSRLRQLITEELAHHSARIDEGMTDLERLVSELSATAGLDYTDTMGRLEAGFKEKFNIHEELYEVGGGEEVMAAISDVPKAAQQIADRIRADIEKLAAPSGLDPSVLGQAVAALLTAK